MKSKYKYAACKTCDFRLAGALKDFRCSDCDQYPGSPAASDLLADILRQLHSMTPAQLQTVLTYVQHLPDDEPPG